jgi:hypothetical protein
MEPDSSGINILRTLSDDKKQEATRGTKQQQQTMPKDSICHRRSCDILPQQLSAGVVLSFSAA